MIAECLGVSQGSQTVENNNVLHNVILIPVNISWNSVLFIWKVSKRSTLISLLVAACYSTKHVATEINSL